MNVFNVYLFIMIISAWIMLKIKTPINYTCRMRTHWKPDKNIIWNIKITPKLTRIVSWRSYEEIQGISEDIVNSGHTIRRKRTFAPRWIVLDWISFVHDSSKFFGMLILCHAYTGCSKNSCQVAIFERNNTTRFTKICI